MKDNVLESIANALAEHYKIQLKPMRNQGAIQGRSGQAQRYNLYDEQEDQRHVVRFIRNLDGGAYETATVSYYGGEYQLAYKTSGAAAISMSRAKFSALPTREGDTLEARLPRLIRDGFSNGSSSSPTSSAYRVATTISPDELRIVAPVIVSYLSGDTILPAAEAFWATPPPLLGSEKPSDSLERVFAWIDPSALPK